ncbi:MAG: hypothetical protein LBQ50_08825 [Planctomycetaceae bacterium]|jgi:hypothetical protein|nr:hypothetical protein [Planctomycetaceae bacterium]
MAPSVLDVLIAEAEAKGEVKVVKNGQDMVLAVLRKRFTRIPNKIQAAIRERSDTVALKSLNIHAATCQTLDEFAEALN